ncbi:MAG: dihydrolipoyl dehydrogenase [Ponticaulis sp.]|nr:dihydrolipoyl dehydrogenase [Ponticaulis sp.]
MSETKTCDVLVVGGGPGGYPAAIRAGQNGLKTILVEADRLGGTCLIRGCIPSKAIIHASDEFNRTKALAEESSMGIHLSAEPTLAMKELKTFKDGIVDKLSSGVEGLLKAAGVESIKGWASFTNAKTCRVQTSDGEIEISAKNVVLATGSTETELSDIPFDGEHILSSRDVLDLDELPEKVAIIGSGYIGVELGTALHKLGADVTFLEAAPRILMSFDDELVRPVQSWMKTRKIDVLTDTIAKSAKITDSGVELTLQKSDETTDTLTVDKVIVSVGRKPVLEDWGFKTMGVDLAGKFIKVDATCQTSMSGVYAIGDITGEPMLAHRATAQGECVADVIAGEKRHFDPVAIPAICFCEPELVSVGLSAKEAEDKGDEIITGRFPFAASGRALSMQAADSKGFVRVTARKEDHVILGIQAVGQHVSELSGEFTLALEMGAVLEDVAHTIHAHPSLSEATAESMLAALGTPIHVAKSS